MAQNYYDATGTLVLDKAADLVLAQAKLLLNGIRDEGRSKDVTRKLIALLSSSESPIAEE